MFIQSNLDNEYFQGPAPQAEYFAELEEAYRTGGVVVPLYVMISDDSWILN